jgi:predicted dehydrogenase
MQTADTTAPVRHLRAGMVGMGMIFDETYRPFFEGVYGRGIHDPAFGVCMVDLAAVASRTGRRADAYRQASAGRVARFESFTGDDSGAQLVAGDVDYVCVATPDDRHFDSAVAALGAGKHVIIEKPSVLTLTELDTVTELARSKNLLAKIVYHKLLDPDHKKLRTLVVDGVLRHVNNGYCTLLEPKMISGQQFAQWITGRNPGTYVAVHYIKLIDFTFGGKLKYVTCTGQRGLVGPADGPTWDSTQLRMVYTYDDGRDAAFDIHTSWVTPDNFPGYVEQEVQFRFDNGVWNGHSRKRGVELTVEGETPIERKISMNNHYNGTFVEPWNERSQRGYGIEVLERFAREVAYLEFGGSKVDRKSRYEQLVALDYNDVAADRQVVATVQAMEAILAAHTAGEPNATAQINHDAGGLVLWKPGQCEPEVLYEPPV